MFRNTVHPCVFFLGEMERALRRLMAHRLRSAAVGVELQGCRAADKGESNPLEKPTRVTPSCDPISILIS